MADRSSWVSHIEAFVDTEQDGSIEAIAQLVNKGVISLLELVREMEMYLTTKDNIIRSRGILLLGEILSRITQKPLDSTAIDSLADFFISRLEDWSSLKGALIGCLAILRRKNISGTISQNDVKRLSDNFFTAVLVSSLGSNDRKLCYEIIISLCTDHSETLLSRGEELFHEILQSIDEEKDPDCLIYCFRAVRISMRLLAVLSDAAIEDAFDVLSNYFPVYFTHGGGGTEGTREELSETLLDIFCSSPNFAQYVIPFLLEKLATSFPLAKIDSLKYLQKCISYYGPEKISDHTESIWSTLKTVIFNKQEDQIAKEALKCFKTLVSVLISPKKDSLFDLISEKIDSILKENNFSNFSSENQDELRILGSVYAIMSGVSEYLCTRVFQKYFAKFVGEINSLNFGALYLVCEIISACKGLTRVDTELTLEKEVSWWNILRNYSDNLSIIFISLVNNNITSLEEGINNTVITQQYIHYAVKGLQELATFPPCYSIISDKIYISILETFISIINSKYQNSFLWKLSLESLVHIGSSIEKFHDSNKESVYNNIILEKIISIFQNSSLPIEMKLDAIYGIGTVGTSYMKRVVRIFEDEIILNIDKICLEGEFEVNSAEIVVSLLEFYSKRILAWLCNSGGVSELAMQFAIHIWTQMENATILSNIHIKGILDSIIQTMKHLVASCTADHQFIILQKSFEIVLKTISFPVESIPSFDKIQEYKSGFSNPVSLQDLNLISLFSSVVISLRPQTLLPNSNSNLILNLFLYFLLNGHIPSAQAFASILNKSSTNDKQILDKSIENCLLILSKDENILRKEIITGFSWIGKGLVMRGDERSKEIIKFLLKCVLLSSENESLDVQLSAAEGFYVIMSDSEGVLCKNVHAVIKPLYKQRLFASLLPVFLDSMRESDRSNKRVALCRAFGHVICNAPLTAVISQANKIVPAIADSITTLGTEIQNKYIIYSLLLVLSGILTDSNGKEAIIENLHIVVRMLAQLVSYPHMMVVRETAIQCLAAMSNLSHSKIYPMRPQVLRAVISALDDKKSAVRKEAVKCRHAWSRSF
ncbi:hypothetical protein LUZ60_008385 [Juncus effusus]|nr:hypothetical protein LUZ60_008385 [Juncus effusus]